MKNKAYRLTTAKSQQLHNRLGHKLASQYLTTLDTFAERLTRHSADEVIARYGEPALLGYLINQVGIRCDLRELAQKVDARVAIRWESVEAAARWAIKQDLGCNATRREALVALRAAADRARAAQAKAEALAAANHPDTLALIKALES